jgi:hypothetical protein
MITVQFPEMRLEVVEALQSLADPQRQKKWGQVKDGINYYDDLTLNVNILYDDCQVLPDPSLSIGSILYPNERDVLHAVHEALNPLLNNLGNKPDGDYLADPQWPAVIMAAREALQTMIKNESAVGWNEA